MAECYSAAGSAPLQALASSLLGESSSFTFKHQPRPFHPHNQFSHHQQAFPPSTSLQQQQQQQQHIYHHHHHHHDHHLNPQLDHKQHKLNSDPFDHAWSSATQLHPSPPSFKEFENDRYQYTNFLDRHTGPIIRPQRPSFNHEDPNLITSWDHAVRDTANKGLWEQSAGLNSRPPPDLSVSEFESFHYTARAPVDPPSTTSLSQDWASELVAQDHVEVVQLTTMDDEEDDDEEDEYREEWSNDHFTQAYINTHQSQFQKIQEHEQLKEAQRQEERERLKRPVINSTSYMASSTAASGVFSTTTRGGIIQEHGRRLRVPGLDPPVDEEHNGVSFSLDEYWQFCRSLETQNPSLPSTVNRPPKPVHAHDRFLSLVSDLHVAGQIYYPGASSATHSGLPEFSSLAATDGDSWATEFSVETELSSKIQKHLGAEWSWEKLFGKDPRKAAERAQKQLEQQHASVHLSPAEQSEHERLKSIALSRLQAVFSHLSLTTPPPA
ncbi:hypothetical protein BGZ94_009682 [Podila epigama]|nr:hypothetical protein BGZ94_009682 [Podila epigama]